MPAIDNLNQSELKKLWAAVKKLQTQTPLASSSVERGRLRFYAGSELLIQNGNLTVSGTATIDGQLVGTGTLTWSGTTNLTGTTNLDGPTSVDGTLTINGATTVTGPMSVTGISTFTGKTYMNGEVDLNGPFDVFGDTRIFGTMAIDGATTLSDNLTVGSGGKITAGGVSLEPTGGAFGGGRITSASGITIDAPLTVFPGGIGVDGNASFSGTLSNTAMGTTTEASNVHVNSSGRFLKVTSASRFKLDTKPSALPDALLDVPVKDWIDSQQAGLLHELASAPKPLTDEQQAEWDASSYTRIPGVIAEEVEAAGGELFVTYDTDGQIHGVAYDRFALARTQILADRLERALERITELEANR